MKLKHLGVEYSIADRGAGRWEWKLRPKKEAGISGRMMTGEVFGTLDDAIAAATAAIDKELGSASG